MAGQVRMRLGTPRPRMADLLRVTQQHKSPPLQRSRSQPSSRPLSPDRARREGVASSRGDRDLIQGRNEPVSFSRDSRREDEEYQKLASEFDKSLKLKNDMSGSPIDNILRDKWADITNTNISDNAKLEKELTEFGEKIKDKIHAERMAELRRNKLEKLVEDLKRRKTKPNERVNLDHVIMGDSSSAAKGSEKKAWKGSMGLEDFKEREAAREMEKSECEEMAESRTSSRHGGRLLGPSTDEGLDELEKDGAAIRGSRMAETLAKEKMANMSFLGASPPLRQSWDQTGDRQKQKKPIELEISSDEELDTEDEEERRLYKREKYFYSMSRWGQVFAHVDMWLSEHTVTYLANQTSHKQISNLTKQEIQTRQWILGIIESQVKLGILTIAKALEIEEQVIKDLRRGLRDIVATFYIIADEVSIPKLDKGQWKLVALVLLRAQSKVQIPSLKKHFDLKDEKVAQKLAGVLKDISFSLAEFEEMCTLF